MEQNTTTDHNNILDLISFDLTKFYIGDYKEIGTEDTPAILIVDYEKRLAQKEFNIFDTLRFRVLFDKSNITGETHINASFRAKKKRISKEETIELVNKLSNYFGADNSGRSNWSTSDEDDFNSYNLHRIWSSGLGDNFVSISYKEITGLELNILFLNNLLKHSGKQLLF